MRIIILGSPGSGKGTLCKALAQKIKYEHLDIGQILRDETIKGTQDGILIKEYQAKGELAPSDIVQRIVLNKLNQSSNCLLDGSPRKKIEAQYYIQNGINFDLLFNLNVPESLSRERLVKRGRFDDNEEALNNRFRVHKTQVKESLDFFRKMGIVIDIDADKSVEDVLKEMVKYIGE